MDFKEKNLIYWFIFIAACCLYFLLLMPVFNSLKTPIETTSIVPANPNLHEQKGMASLSLIYPDKKRAFEGEVLDELITVNDILMANKEAGNFNYAMDGHNGDYIIDDVSARDGKEWNCYLNDILVEAELADQKIVKNGDKVVCKYE